uniref:CACTA en-spm transposon protein n=1 Tax=Cucumis melo TaxID=3656 RepID=A0A9I9E8C6_CUCME
SSSQQPATPNPRRRAQSRFLEFERHVAINGPILMTIAPGAEKSISPYAVRFSQAIGIGFLCLISMIKQSTGLLSIRCSRPLKSFELTVTDSSKSTTTRRRLVPTHQTYWLDVIKIDTSSATTR